MGRASWHTGESGSGACLGLPGLPPHGTGASVRSEAGSPRHEPRTSGNLFLTCLRLRFEERGSWSKALESPAGGNSGCFGHGGERESTPPPPRPGSPYASPAEGVADEVAEPAELPAAFTAPASPPQRDSQPLGSAEVRLSWREWMGLSPWGSTRAYARRLLKGESRRAGSAALAFGRAGLGVELLPAEEGHWEPLVVAARKERAKDHALALTAAPLTPRPASETGCCEDGVRRYYFELEVLETSRGTAQTCSLGFAWAPPSEGPLPPVLGELPRTLSVGGEPLRARLCGRDLGKVAGWRPAVHLQEGSVVGALLEVRAPTTGTSPSEPILLRMLVLQDGEARAELHAKLAAEDGAGWAASPELAPHGAVDIAGNVRRVRLHRGAAPPPRKVPMVARAASASRVGGS